MTTGLIVWATAGVVSARGAAAADPQGGGTYAPVLAQRAGPPLTLPGGTRVALPARGGTIGAADVAVLANDLRGLISLKTRNGRWGAIVVSLSRGDTLYAQNADERLTPASTLKLFTTAVALERFGPDYHFTTDVLRDGPIEPDGTLRGNVILRGGGDPALSNRFLRGDAAVPMDLLASALSAAGIRRVTGDLIADASAFDERRVPEGWLARYLQDRYAARVSALSFNENMVSVVVRPTDTGTPDVVLEPPTNALALVRSVRQVAGRAGASVVVRRVNDTTFEAKGWIGARTVPQRYDVVVEEPALFAAGALRASLTTVGITISGHTRAGVAPAGAIVVSALPSPPLERLVSVMNRESINHYAELIFRNSGRGPAGTSRGSAESGLSALSEFLTRTVGAAPGSVYAVDGSGLSTLDRVTPRAMVQLLGYAHTATWSSAFHASLPVAGESELLRGRMRQTAAQGNLHAKTGTTNNVIGLGGYVTAANGEVLGFAFLYNGTDRANARATIDVIGARLATFTRD